jgi:tRNA pseudouridine38-40 synthase
MPRLRLTLSYDGTAFGGSQIQPGQRTVQGELEARAPAARWSVRRTHVRRADRPGGSRVGQVVAVSFPEWRATAGDLERALAARLPGDMAAQKS